MKILFLTKSKLYTIKMLKYMLENGHSVDVVCKSYDDFEDSEMHRICLENNINVYDNKSVYKKISNALFPKYDLAISNTYGRLIKKELIDWLDGRIINIHGAILPDYKGMFTYNWGIFNGEKEWGVTAHYVNEEFDCGDIITISRFSIDPTAICVKEIEELTQKKGYELMIQLVQRFEKDGGFEATPQKETGHYYSREDFENLKIVKSTDSADVVKRKIHACWCPPYEGAYYMVDGERFYFRR